MTTYLHFVIAHPILSAIIQFAILGTLGEVAARNVAAKRWHYPFSPAMTLWKMLVWSLLAVCIKYAFVGFNGFVDGLVSNRSPLLPATFLEKGSFLRALAISFFMNLQFGPFLILIHRLLDNLMEKEKTWRGIDKGLYSLLWFWIPAHTVTFMLPKEFQIGLAALWSLALGFILGFIRRRT
jgi:hypothetical protein